MRTPPTTPPSLVDASNQPTAYTEASSTSTDNDPEVSPITLTPTNPSIFSKKSSKHDPSEARRSSGDDLVHSKISGSSRDKLGKVDNFPSHGGTEDSSVTPTPTSPIATLGKSDEGSKENRRAPESASRRPPILKKGSSGSSRTSKSADEDRALSFQAGSSSARRTTSTRFNEEVAVSIPKPPSSVPRNSGERSTRSGGESSQKSAKRNLVVVASNAANKTKPAFIRQRSSAGSSRDAPSRSSSQQNLARSPKSQSASASTESPFVPRIKLSPDPESAKGSLEGAGSYTTRVGKRSLRDSPSGEVLSEEFEESEVEPDDALSVPQESKSALKSKKNAAKTSTANVPEGSKPLVEPNFRAKFIDRTKASQRSLTDLSAFARKSSAAIPTSASYQATGMLESMHAPLSAGRSQGREAFTNVTAPLKAPAPAGPEATSNENPTLLPTTKSQLTLLLKKEKTRSDKGERKNRKTDL